MVRHSIYSVRDKCKVDAEVIEVREIEGKKGVRYQLVGLHPDDGTRVTTFCSAAMAADYKHQMGTLPHGLAAEGVEEADHPDQPAPDQIPEAEAPIMSAEGVEIVDDPEELYEEPVVKTPTEEVEDSSEVQVFASEGESDAETSEDTPEEQGASKIGEAGIDIELPSQIIQETYDSADLVVPDPSWMPSGGGPVLGQQTGKVNATPLHAEDDEEPGECACGVLCVCDCGCAETGACVCGESCPCPCGCGTEDLDAETATWDPYEDEVPYDWEDDYSGSDVIYDADEWEDDKPPFYRRRSVLVPTAVLGGLFVAYTMRPELFSGLFNTLNNLFGSSEDDDEESDDTA